MSKTWYSHFSLDSGLNVLAAPLDTPSVTAAFVVKAGSKNEDPAVAGVSHFLEHFVFKGTKKYPTSQTVMRALDSIGAEHNAATTKESTVYWVKTAAANLPKAMEMIGELVFRPLLPGKLLPQEKGTILQEMAMIEDHPMAKVGEKFETLMFGEGTALGREIIGTKKTIVHMSRQQLTDYRRRQYRVDNSVLVVAGGVKPEEVVRMASRAFGVLPLGRSTGSPNLRHPAGGAGRSVISSPRRLVEFRKTDQVHLIMGRPAFPRLDPRRYALGLLMTVLGGNSSSRLFQQIREARGLAYYIRAGSSRYQEDGYVAIAAGVAPDKAAEAEAEILKIADRLTVTKQELAEARGFVLGHLALDWEESHFIAGHLADDFLFENENKIRSREEIEDIIKKVNLGEVNDLSRWLCGEDEPMSLAAIGPVDAALKAKRKFEF